PAFNSPLSSSIQIILSSLTLSSPAILPTSSTSPTNPRSVTITPAPLSFNIYPSRLFGYPGSSGTYAPPAFHIPSNPATISNPLLTYTPTSFSGPTPASRKRPAH